MKEIRFALKTGHDSKLAKPYTIDMVDENDTVMLTVYTTNNCIDAARYYTGIQAQILDRGWFEVVERGKDTEGNSITVFRSIKEITETSLDKSKGMNDINGIEDDLN